MNSWILFALLCTVLIAGSSKGWLHSKTYPGWYIFSPVTYIYRSYESTDIERIMCDWRCYNTPNCGDTTYNPALQTCSVNVYSAEIYSYYGTNEYQVTRMNFNREMLMIEVTTESTSNWTNGIADVYCRKLDTRLALYEEVLAAYEDYNYWYFYCGMIADGYGVWTNNNTVQNCSITNTYAFCKNL